MAAALADHWWGLAPGRIGVVIDDHHLLHADALEFLALLIDVLPLNVHVLSAGQIVRSGGPELALELEKKGYDWLVQ